MKNMNKIIVSLLLVSLLFSAGCTPGKQPVDSNVRTDIIVGMSGEPISIEPQSCYDAAGSKIVCNVYEGLVTMDENNKIQPNLAESWTLSDDAKTYTFKLRKDIKFHNGDLLEAVDVKYSIDMAKERGFGEETTNHIKEVRIIDPHTVEIELNHVYKPMLQHFAMCRYLNIVNEELARAAGDDFAINPTGAGTGPFEFVEWNAGVNIKLKANENFHRGAPKLKEVTFKFIPENSAGAIALETGDVDIYTDLSFVDVPNLQKNPKLQVDIRTGRYAYYLCLNELKEPYNNLKLRKAIAYAINTDEFIVGVLNGMGGVKTGTVVFPQTFGYSPNCPPIEQDLEKAKQLLAEAGFSNGVTLHMLATDGIRKRSAEAIQGMLSKIGIDLKIEILEFSAMVDRQVSDQHEIIIMNSSAPIYDADAELTDKIMTGSWGNFSRYSNPTVDKLMEEARVELDDNKRLEMYEQIQAILYEELPIIPLYHANVASGANAKLKNFRAWGNNDVCLENMSWEP